MHVAVMLLAIVVTVFVGAGEGPVLDILGVLAQLQGRGQHHDLLLFQFAAQEPVLVLQVGQMSNSPRSIASRISRSP